MMSICFVLNETVGGLHAVGQMSRTTQRSECPYERIFRRGNEARRRASGARVRHAWHAARARHGIDGGAFRRSSRRPRQGGPGGHLRADLRAHPRSGRKPRDTALHPRRDAATRSHRRRRRRIRRGASPDQRRRRRAAARKDRRRRLDAHVRHRRRDEGGAARSAPFPCRSKSIGSARAPPCCISNESRAVWDLSAR